MADTTHSHSDHEDAQNAGAIPLIDFAHVFSVLRNRFLMIVAITVLFCGAAVVLSLFMRNFYVSTVSILVDPEGSRVVEGELLDRSGATDARALNQQYILTSVKVLTSVVKSLDLADDPDFGARQPYEPDADQRAQRALAGLQEAIHAELNQSSFVINLSVLSFDPQKAARIANAIAQTYIDTRLEMNNSVVRQATTDLSAQLASLEKAVEEGDRAIQAYRAENNLIDVGGRPTAEQQIADTNTEITRISASIADNEALISELALARSNPDYLRSTPDTSLTPAIIELRTRYHAAQEQEAVLRSSFGDRHPSLLSARARTHAVSRLLDTQLKDFTTSLSRNADKLKSQRELLRQNLATLKAGLNENDQSMVRLRELERKLASDRAVYEAFLLRTRQLSGQERTTSENPQIISAAQVPLGKSGPKRSLIVAGATMLGMLFGCGIALALDHKPRRRDLVEDDAQRSGRAAGGRSPMRLLGWLRRRQDAGPEEDVRHQEPAPSLSVTPTPSRGLRPSAEPAALHGSYADIAEELLLKAGGQGNYCIVLYSAQPGTSPSRTALHLARAAARAGSAVLLVDAEAEAGLTRQASALGLPGLYDSISLQRLEGDFINLSNARGPWLLPAGRRSPRISTRRGAEAGTLPDWLDASGHAFDLVIVYAGRFDQPKPVPAVETAAGRFAVIANRFNRKGTDGAVAFLEHRGLWPVASLVIDDEESRVSRAG